MGDILIEKRKDFSAVGKCSNVVCKVTCWHKKITTRFLAASALTANEIRFNYFGVKFTLNTIIEHGDIAAEKECHNKKSAEFRPEARSKNYSNSK